MEEPFKSIQVLYLTHAEDTIMKIKIEKAEVRKMEKRNFQALTRRSTNQILPCQ